MMEKIENVLITIVNAVLGILLVSGMGIAILIGSIFEGSLFGAFIGIVLIVMGGFAFGMGQHDMVEWDSTKEES